MTVTEPTTQDVTPVDPAVARLALHVGIFRERAEQAIKARDKVRGDAQKVFAALRNRAIPSIEVKAPDGTKVALVSINTGGVRWDVNEGLFTAVAVCNDPRDLEQHVDPKALTDPAVIEAIKAVRPDLVKRRIKPVVRALYQKEWESNGGHITDMGMGERVKVATSTHLPATGEFSYRPVAAFKDKTPLLDAIAAGLMNEWGELPAQAVTRAELGTVVAKADAPATVVDDDVTAPDPAALAAADRAYTRPSDPAASIAGPGGTPLLSDLLDHFGLTQAEAEHVNGCVDCVLTDTGVLALCPEFTTAFRPQQPGQADIPATPPAEPSPWPVLPGRTPDEVRAAMTVQGPEDAKAWAAKSRRAPAKRSQLKPTGEQQAILDAWTDTDDNLTVKAVAGSGKTSTQVMLADATSKAGLYIAYNKAIATEAGRRFPSHVTCKTAHAVAFAVTGRDFAHRIGGARVPARDAARILGINDPLRLDPRVMLAPEQVARLALEMCDQFMHSADPEPGPQHAPFKPGFSDDANKVLRAYLPALARKAWADLCDTNGRLHYTPDAYLKLWSLGNPDIPVDYVLLDEAQDTDPVFASVLAKQSNARLIAVGDPSQEIYAWRGACNAMDNFGGKLFTLTESFRFGPQIAAEANKWLAVLGEDVRVVGNRRKSSMIRPVEWPDAVLCRTNGGALAEAIAASDAGKKPALVGGGNAIKKMAEAAERLQQGRPAYHPELIAFSNWGQVQDYVADDPGGSDLAVMVRLIDSHGPAEIIRIVDSLASERNADVVISTAHKAKGLEWDSVRIATDFPAPRRRDDDSEPEVRPADARLAYVAVTRAKQTLDREGLAWVDRFLPVACAA